MAAAKEITVKLPAQVFGLAGRYANALYMAASKVNSLDSVETDLKELKKTLDTDAKFKRFVLDPSVSRRNKSEAMAKAFAASNEVTRKFVGDCLFSGVDHRCKGLTCVLQEYSLTMEGL
jgi:F-type H+-transporting ATPase subunit O